MAVVLCKAVDRDENLHLAQKFLAYPKGVCLSDVSHLIHSPDSTVLQLRMNLVYMVSQFPRLGDIHRGKPAVEGNDLSRVNALGCVKVAVVRNTAINGAVVLDVRRIAQVRSALCLIHHAVLVIHQGKELKVHKNPQRKHGQNRQRDQ